MRTLPASALAALALASACGERPSTRGAQDAPPRAAPAGEALVRPVAAPPNAAGFASRVDMPIPVGSVGARATSLAHRPLPVAKAGATLPRGPFAVIRSAADLASLWRRAGGEGSPPAVDFSGSTVIALRLPPGAARDTFAPTAHVVGGRTQVVLHPGTPRGVGARPGDRIELYRISTTGAPIYRVRYDTR
jgi:hypothetical protein